MRGKPRLAGAVACVLLLVGAVPAAAATESTCPNADLSPSPDNASQAIASAICLINAERVTRGLEPLRWNTPLSSAAQWMAGQTVTAQFLGHTTPDGITLEDRALSNGYVPAGWSWSVAEDLGFGDGALGTPAGIVDTWMQSSEHRDNLLDPAFSDVGIGYAIGSPVAGGGSGAMFVADFGHAAPPRTQADAQTQAGAQTLSAVRSGTCRRVRSRLWRSWWFVKRLTTRRSLNRCTSSRM
jgi:uncharacterized protein YkwD